jgi:hypothetical protein
MHLKILLFHSKIWLLIYIVQFYVNAKLYKRL